MSAKIAPYLYYKRTAARLRFLQTKTPPLCKGRGCSVWFTKKFRRHSTVSSRKLMGRNPSLQEISAEWGFFIHPS